MVNEKWTVTKSSVAKWLAGKQKQKPQLTPGMIVRKKRNDNGEGEVLGEADKRGQYHIRFEDGEEVVQSAQVDILQDPPNTFVWETVEDMNPFQYEQPKEYREVGILGFDFAKEFETGNDDGTKSLPYLKLFQHLWPGKSF